MDHQRILAWAELHLERLDESTRAFAKKNPAVLVTKYDSKTAENVVTLKVRRIPKIEDEWPFLIGDALHNMRVALDYITFQIVKPPANNWDLVRKTQFPIAKRQDDWNGQRAHRLSTLSPNVQAAFEALQPYHESHSPGLEPLFVLDALENVHKHRELLDAYPSVTSRGFSGSSKKIRFTASDLPFGPVEHDKELYRYVWVDPQDAETNLKFHAAMHVCFDREGPARGQIVVTALEDIRDHIRNVVFPALEHFI